MACTIGAEGSGTGRALEQQRGDKKTKEENPRRKRRAALLWKGTDSPPLEKKGKKKANFCFDY